MALIMSDHFVIRDLVKETLKGITPKYLIESNIIVLNQKCIRNNKINYKYARYHDPKKLFDNKKKVQVGDILINSTGEGTLGRSVFVKNLIKNKTVILDSHILIVRISDFYTAGCLQFILYSIQDQLQSFKEGSTGQGEFDKERLFNINGFLPSKKNRKSIFEALSAIEFKVEINTQISIKLKSIAKTIFDYWFVQFDFPDKDGNPYKSSGGNMVYNDLIKREIPDGWSVTLIKEVISTSSNSVKLKKNEIMSKGKYPVIDQGSKFISGYTNRVDALVKSKPIHIVFGDHSANIKFVNFDFARGADGTQVLYSNNPRLGSVGLYFSLLNTNIKSSGYARHFKFLKECKIILPINDISTKFENKIMSNFQAIETLRKENEHLLELRDWLVPMFMNGQLSLNT